MIKVSGEERQVLGYLKNALDRNMLDGVSSVKISNDLDVPLDKVNEACQKLEEKDYAHIEKRNMVNGRLKDLVAWIKPHGIEYLQKENGIPL